MISPVIKGYRMNRHSPDTGICSPPLAARVVRHFVNQWASPGSNGYFNVQYSTLSSIEHQSYMLLLSKLIK